MDLTKKTEVVAMASMPEWKKKARDIFINEIYRKFQNDTGKSDERIANELGICVSTMRNTLNKEEYFNTDFAIAFCTHYKIGDLNYLFTGVPAEPRADVSEEGSFTVFRHSADCHTLEDEAFLGTFYGYCRNTQYNHILDDFILDVTRSIKGTVQARLHLNTHNQRGEVAEKILYGKPMHLEPDTVYMVMQSDRGDDLFIFQYSWFKINSGKRLYCRYGGLLTPCRGTVRFPQVQSFVLLDAPVKEENLPYVDGFLDLTQDKIPVPAHLMDGEDGLLQRDESVKSFFKACRGVHYEKEEFYCYSERVLLALGEACGVERDLTAKTILTLKKNSINPKVVDFPDQKVYSKFLSSLTEKTEA
ncbi:MAG: hypothetical protein IJC84_02245 [Clostridia bacterium]|nr:hypothetical protein [Clostridia bacterium]